MNDRANVPVSLGLGSLVAGALNAELVRDDIARAVASDDPRSATAVN
ncbi:hypothetical protein [Microbacterium sp.]